jgi:hypothetical protein
LIVQHSLGHFHQLIDFGSYSVPFPLTSTPRIFYVFTHNRLHGSSAKKNKDISHLIKFLLLQQMRASTSIVLTSWYLATYCHTRQTA